MNSRIHRAAGLAAAIFTLIGIQGCLFSDSTGYQDEVSGQDVMQSEDTGYIHYDAVVLGDSWQEDAGVNGDTGNEWSDTSSSMDTGITGDYVESDSVFYEDTTAGDESSVADTSQIDTPVPDDVSQDDIENGLRMKCYEDGTGCPEGYSCESDNMGGWFCRPFGECSSLGLTPAGDLVRGLSKLNANTPVFIKISATVTMGSPTCSTIQCPQDDPCCKQCVAGLIVETGLVPIILVGSKEMPIGCAGYECRLQAECKPFSPGSEYIIWGTAQMFADGPQIRVDGFCHSSDIDA